MTQENDPENSMVCYCFRLTTGQLKRAYAQCGSLAELEKQTKVGSECTGCKVILQSLFGEIPSDQYKLSEQIEAGSTCKKPGHRVMKGFVIADGELESSIYSSNAVAPQFGNCDADTPIEYALVDHKGQVLIQRQDVLKTNDTFVFNTKDFDLPRPFFGMFLLAFNRSNYGASRFNVYWRNKNGVSATHENATTGRPLVYLPISVDKNFLNGTSTMYAAIMNPHHAVVPYTLSVFDPENEITHDWNSELPPFCSMWLNLNEHLFKPALEKHPNSRFIFKLQSETDMYHALSMYFFAHNRSTDLWTVNHL